jgi:bifunctional DNA-binding transcriptional regulator/antitoxin component of YhaV-PrlF toxin-antitoxin module
VNIDLDRVVSISETSVTIRGSRRRTTVPKLIAEKLRLEDGDRIRWILMTDGSILLTPVAAGDKEA